MAFRDPRDPHALAHIWLLAGIAIAASCLALAAHDLLETLVKTFR